MMTTSVPPVEACRCGRALHDRGNLEYDTRHGSSTWTVTKTCSGCDGPPESCPCPPTTGAPP